MELALNNFGWDNLGSWSTAKKFSVLLIWLIFFTCLLYFVLLRATWNKQQKIATKVRTLAMQVEQQKQALAQMPTPKTLDGEIDQNHVELQNLYITPQHLYQWLGVLAQMAQQDQLALVSSQPLLPIQANFYQELPLHLRVVGTYAQLTRFIAQIVNLKPLFLMAGFSLAPKNQADYNGQLLLDLHLHTFAANNNSDRKVAEFINPSLTKLDLSLAQDPFSKNLLQTLFAISHLQMLGSISDAQHRWAVLQNGNHIVHVRSGQNLDAHTQIIRVTEASVTIKQADRLWQIFLEERK